MEGFEGKKEPWALFVGYVKCTHALPFVWMFNTALHLLQIWLEDYPKVLVGTLIHNINGITSPFKKTIILGKSKI